MTSQVSIIEDMAKPTVFTQKEIDKLYDLYEILSEALDSLGIKYTLIAGSLLGAVRSRSILFNDDDIDVAVFSDEDYLRVVEELPPLISERAWYKKRPWPAADKIRSKAAPYIWIDLFVLKRFESFDQVFSLVYLKENGDEQSFRYVSRILDALLEFAAASKQSEQAGWSCCTDVRLDLNSTPDRNAILSLIWVHLRVSKGLSSLLDIEDRDSVRKVLPPELPLRTIEDIVTTLESSIFPIWHYDTRKAQECWPKEFFAEAELFPLRSDYKLGQFEAPGPADAIPYLLRAYGRKCFREYPMRADHSKWVKELRGRPDQQHHHDKDKKNSNHRRDNCAGSSDGYCVDGTEHVHTDIHIDIHTDTDAQCVLAITPVIDTEEVGEVEEVEGVASKEQENAQHNDFVPSEGMLPLLPHHYVPILHSKHPRINRVEPGNSDEVDHKQALFDRLNKAGYVL
jgi:hypothetical protein